MEEIKKNLEADEDFIQFTLVCPIMTDSSNFYSYSRIIAWKSEVKLKFCVF